MADSSTLTYEQDPPRRPTLDDLDGGNCTDDPKAVPVPGQDPSADAMNQRDKLIVALCAMMGAAWLHVTFSGGTPTKTACGGMRQGGEAFELTDFTLTDNGPGDTSAVHSGGLLPPKTLPAQAYSVHSVAAEISCEPITNGGRVRTKVAASAADAAFVIIFYGV